MAAEEIVHMAIQSHGVHDPEFGQGLRPAHLLPDVDTLGGEDRPVEATCGDLSVPTEAELWELLRQRLPHQPFRIAVAHQEPWRDTCEEGGKVGIPERVKERDP